jgi:hypothetical protein
VTPPRESLSARASLAIYEAPQQSRTEERAHPTTRGPTGTVPLASRPFPWTFGGLGGTPLTKEAGSNRERNTGVLFIMCSSSVPPGRARRGWPGGCTAAATPRPCRAPPRSISDVSLIGGGQVPRPSEVPTRARPPAAAGLSFPHKRTPPMPLATPQAHPC